MTFSQLIVGLISIATTSISASAKAERTLDEATIQIKGETRRFYHLHDSEALGNLPIIVLVSGSGCGDFGMRFPTFFEFYPSPLDVYFLEKPYIEKGASGQPGTCSDAYNHADYLNRRVSDTLEFIESEPNLKVRSNRSLAILGFSEGGVVAPIVAAQSEKIGWLATAGAGGMKQSEGFLVFANRGVTPYANPFSAQILKSKFEAIAKDPDSLENEFFGHSYAYWNSHLFYDPLPTYAKLDIPMVAAMGEKDESEPIESGRLLQSYFSNHPKKKFQFVEYKNASHGLQVDGKSNAKLFVANLAKWFKGDPNAFNQSP
jgi:pimeloyl-ACP methyl ester carboxylesterase